MNTEGPYTRNRRKQEEETEQEIKRRKTWCTPSKVIGPYDIAVNRAIGKIKLEEEVKVDAPVMEENGRDLEEPQEETSGLEVTKVLSGKTGKGNDTSSVEVFKDGQSSERDAVAGSSTQDLTTAKKGAVLKGIEMMKDKMNKLQKTVVGGSSKVTTGQGTVSDKCVQVENGWLEGINAAIRTLEENDKKYAAKLSELAEGVKANAAKISWLEESLKNDAAKISTVEEASAEESDKSESSCCRKLMKRALDWFRMDGWPWRKN